MVRVMLRLDIISVIGGYMFSLLSSFLVSRFGLAVRR